jgi:hypothetical protein
MPEYPVLPSVSFCLSAASRHVSHSHHPPSFYHSSAGMMRGSRCTISCMHLAALPIPKKYSLRRSHWTVLYWEWARQPSAWRAVLLYCTARSCESRTSSKRQESAPGGPAASVLPPHDIFFCHHASPTALRGNIGNSRRTFASSEARGN